MVGKMARVVGIFGCIAEDAARVVQQFDGHLLYLLWW